MKGKLEYCAGCREDHYNQPGNSTTGRCWNLDTAESVTRYKLAWWTAPTESGAFAEVKTNSCHREPGQFAFYEKLPDFAVDVRGGR